MKNYKNLMYAFSILLFASCSKDDSGSTAAAPAVVNDDPISGQFQKRVLVEDFTGTWCGYCPRVAYGIQQVQLQTSKSVPVAIHRGNDPYNFANGSVLEDQIGLTGYPTAKLNRTITWNYPENTNISQVKNLVLNNCGLGLAMNSTVSGGNINLDVKIKFAKDYSDLKLVVYVVEDNLIYDQNNYTSLYGGVSTITNFEYDDVLRAPLTNLLGDAITESTVTGALVTKSFSVPVPSNVANANNIHFVAFVIGSDKKAINVRAANPGENQTFEVNP